MKAWLTFNPLSGWALWAHKPKWKGRYWWAEGMNALYLGDVVPEGWREETYTRPRIWPVTVRLA